MCSLIKRIKELIMQTLRQFTGAISKINTDYDYTSDDFKPLLIYYKLHKKRISKENTEFIWDSIIKTNSLPLINVLRIGLI